MEGLILTCVLIVCLNIIYSLTHILSILINLEMLIILALTSIIMFSPFPITISVMLTLVMSVTTAAVGLSITTYSTRSSLPSTFLTQSMTW